LIIHQSYFFNFFASQEGYAMDIFKQQWARIQEQLSALSATQRMLTASLVAIMILTMMLWGRYATTAEMVPVLNSSFDDQAIVHATMALKAEGIDSTVSGDRILVSADKHDQALAILSFEQLLPADSKSGFDDIIKMTNPFDTDKKNDLMFTRARAAELSQIIRDWHGVADAQVVINPVYEHHIGESLKPSAAVNIRTRGDGDLDVKHMVDAAASTVASATSGLDRSHVSVIIDGRPFKPHDDSNGLADGSLYEQTAEQEQHFEDKIAKGLANYTNPLISVSVNLDVKTSVATKMAYEPAASVQKEASVDTETDDNNQSSAGGGEPGVQPNVGLSINPSGGSGGTTSNTEHDKTEYVNQIGYTNETVTTPSGQEQVVSAAVGLPRSHFVELYGQMNPSAKEPDETTLRNWAQPEIQRVKHQVQSACGLKGDENIFVDLYADVPDQPAVSLATSPAGSTTVALTGHIKEIAIGALAMISLFMVSMMVRKNGPTPVSVAAGAGEAGGSGSGLFGGREMPVYAGDDEIAAVVGAGQTAMDGMELDDDALKSQQVVEQVTTMVKENPDAAASLVKRWMNRP
jgi:flagellar biosynthesis/type III secretory pathway M-ring protein FliF/YscJ